MGKMPTNRDRFLLWCRECRRAIECGIEDAERYQVEGWPECCGEVMSLFTRADYERGDAPENLGGSR